MSDWQEHTVTIRSWTINYLGRFASVEQFGQSFQGRVWPENDDDPGFVDYFTTPAIAMASIVLAIEALVQEGA